MAFDPDFVNVILLLDSEGIDGSVAFADKSDSNHTVTAVGDAQIDTGQTNFVGSSALFDGSGDYLEINSVVDDLVGITTFTMEGWTRRSGGLATDTILAINNSTGAVNKFIVAGDLVKYDFGTQVSRLFDGGANLTTVDQWVHWAVVVDGTVLRAYKDGVKILDTTIAANTFSATDTFSIGQEFDSSTVSDVFNGNQEDVRITKNVARYVANFTPPTESFDTPYGILSAPLEFRNINLGNLSAGFEFLLFDGGLFSIPIDFQVNNSTGSLFVGLQFSIFKTGTLAIPLEFENFNNTGTLSIPLQFQQFNTGTLSISLDFKLFIPDAGNSKLFNAAVMLAGVDVSMQITGVITVTAAEGVARLANFTLLPSAGAIDPYSWIGQPVIIDFLENSNVDRIFTGIVHLPTFDPITGLVSFECTDALQESVELIPEDIITSIVGGFWDAAVFSEAKDGWTYAQQRMSTQAVSYDMDVFRMQRVTQWDPKAVADFSFSDNEIIFKSERLELAERRSIINSIKLSLGARFNRKWQRDITGRWQIPDTFQKWLVRTYSLPTSQIITDSLNADVIKSIDFGRLPATGIYQVAGSALHGWVLSEFAKTLAKSVFFTVSRRWLQTVTKAHEIILQSDASVQKHGLLQIESNVTTTIDNGQTWEDYETYSASGGDSVGNGYSADVTGVDYNNALITALNQSKVKILASHRQNRVVFSTSLVPQVDVKHTVAITLPKLSAKGKVSNINHVIDLKEGKATSNITLAIYQPDISAQIDDPLSVDLSISHPVPAGSGNVELDTFIGVDIGIPEDDEAWRGWITNYDGAVTVHASQASTVKTYDKRWALELPGENDTLRDEEKLTQQDTINIAIPQDQLTITV